MKITYHHRNGYAALTVTISIALTLIAMAVSAFRNSRHSQEVQKVTQLKLDYEQKERAFLRALIELVPNAAMRSMMKDSTTEANSLRWQGIFTEALARAGASQGLDPGMISNLEMSPGMISANTGDAANYSPVGMITAPDGSGNFVFPSTNANLSSLPADFPAPPSLSWYGSGIGNDTIYPIVGFNKRRSGTKQFSLIPYPQVNFGYSAQGDNFIAKRNWWSFTVNWGALQSANTGVAASSRTYILSLYEIPSQLGLSSSGTSTGIGRFSDGADWSKISIQGSVYAKKANIRDLNGIASIASRDGVSISDTGQRLGTLTERRELRATVGTFSPFSSSGNSGLVSFTPVNRAQDFFDYFAATPATNRIAQTDWDDYSIGARQCALLFEATQVESKNNQYPLEIAVSAKFPDGNTFRRTCHRNTWWKYPSDTAQAGSEGAYWPIGSPAGNDWPIQSRVLPNGRPCLTLDLEKLPAFLKYINASDTSINNTIWIGPNYNRPGDGVAQNGNVTKSNYPSSNTDMSLIIIKSADLSAYPNGLSIVTPMRIYFADNFNKVPTSPPAGSGILGDWYPPVSIFAPEKRFGIETIGNGLIKVEGQIGILPSDVATGEVFPLDLKEGGLDTIDPNMVSADLDKIKRVEDMPPVNAMNWMTVIDVVH